MDIRQLELEHKILKKALAVKLVGQPMQQDWLIEAAYALLGTNPDLEMHTHMRYHPDTEVRKAYFRELGEEEFMSRDEEFGITPREKFYRTLRDVDLTELPKAPL